MTPVPQVRRRGSRGQQGMSLIEVLAATAILAAGVLSLTVVSNSANQLRKKVHEKSNALLAVETQIQTIATTAFDDIVATHDGRGFDVTSAETGNPMLAPLPADADGLPGSVTITAPNPPGDAGVLIEITVRVDWLGNNGPQSLVRVFRLSRLGSS